MNFILVFFFRNKKKGDKQWISFNYLNTSSQSRFLLILE